MSESYPQEAKQIFCEYIKYLAREVLPKSTTEVNSKPKYTIAQMIHLTEILNKN